MDKRAILNRFSSSDEQRMLFAHILDLAEQAENKNIIKSGHFLSESQCAEAAVMLRAFGMGSYMLFGGYPDAERRCPVFLPDYLTEELVAEDPELAGIAFLKISVGKFDRDKAQLSHRDCLGALMALGIERETIGDIAVSHGIAAIAVKNEMVEYIKENLDSVGRYKVDVTLCSAEEMGQREEMKEYSDTVSSMRLDAVVAAVFSLSRGSASEAIQRGLLTLDSLPESKPDRTVQAGARLALRGKGRVIIDRIDGSTKKGRIRFFYKK